MDTGDRTWRVGELAAATGLSVRTLHHYDEIGLLRPGNRSTSGHRQYNGADVRRLHLILALRGFGLSLADAGQVLDGELNDPRGLIRAQLDLVEEQLAAATNVKQKLLGVLDGLDRAQAVPAPPDTAFGPSAQTFIELIEVMTAMTRALTKQEFDELVENRRRATAELSPKELEAMAERRRQATAELSPEELERMRRAREELMPKG
jgi:DNA-binding transcriptional MerR regulator